MSRALTILGSLIVIAVLLGSGAVMFVFYHYGSGLPDYRQLADYEPAIMTRVYAGDGSLIAEYAVEKRVFVPMAAIPKRVIQAFLSAEDKNFYEHSGVDFQGVARAILINIKNFGKDRRPVGASTITQQVAKNFLLTNEVSVTRKIKEAILAFRIEQAFEKDHILELYLNEIYLGFQSYGVAAAAMNYFNKSLGDLTTGEVAFLAALPKAPNNYNPITRHDAALERRNWVIGRMVEDGHITKEEGDLALAEPLVAEQHVASALVAGADHFVEDIRRDLTDRFGGKQLLEGGLQVRTSLEPHLQEIANRVLRKGLIDYDRRRGWRGPLTKFETIDGWAEKLAAVERPKGLPVEWELSVVLSVSDQAAGVGLSDNRRGSIPLSELQWINPKTPAGQAPVKSVLNVLSVGEVVAVQRIEADEAGNALPKDTFTLRQMPEVEGALVAMDPHTGRVLALVGGFSFEQSEFNRATQALRQPGSAFKPFVYLAAMEAGYTPSNLILDAPFVIDQGGGQGKWKPSNYTDKFYGPSTLRLGVEQSRNLMTVRLAQAVGMDKVALVARNFGINEDLQQVLAMALGAGETTPLKLTTAYAMLVNGGKKITPSLIDRVQDRTGKTVLRHDNRPCPECSATFWTGQDVPVIPDTREQVADPQSAYQIVSILTGVVQDGTGRIVKKVGKPLAGKTGTSNDAVDAWFLGFSPDLAVGIFVGFDQPKSLGWAETGGGTAAPIFKDFMMEALAGKPATPFRIPPGISLVRVNHKTGLPARPGDEDIIEEAFKPGTVPTGTSAVLGGGEVTSNPSGGGRFLGQQY